MIGLAFCLCIVVYGMFLFSGRRQANRIDEAIRVKVTESTSRTQDVKPAPRKAGER